jgi:hypothetical protein
LPAYLSLHLQHTCPNATFWEIAAKNTPSYGWFQSRKITFSYAFRWSVKVVTTCDECLNSNSVKDLMPLKKSKLKWFCLWSQNKDLQSLNSNIIENYSILIIMIWWYSLTVILSRDVSLVWFLDCHNDSSLASQKLSAKIP